MSDSSSDLLHYRAYALEISSPMHLPELVSGGDGRDVSIRFGRVQSPPGSEDIRYGFVGSNEDSVYYYWPQAGTAQVRAGNEIIIDVTPEYDEVALRLVLLGPVLCGLLFQRGFYLLHAGSVQIGSVAAAFAGFSGAGKSTTVGALLARGHALIADDMTAVHPHGAMVAPGIPQQRLWSDTAVALGHDPETLPRLHPTTDKLWHRFAGNLAQGPIPLRRVYLLEDGPETFIETVAPAGAALELLRHSAITRAAETGDNQRRHFERCVALARQVAVRRLTRPRRLDALPDVAQSIEEDLRSDSEKPPSTIAPHAP